MHHRRDKVLCASVWLCLRPAQYLPDAICSGDQVRANDKRASHEDYRACTSHDFTLGLHKLSNLDRFNELNIELYGSLRLMSGFLPCRHPESAISKRHQHTTLHDATTVVVFRLGYKTQCPAVTIAPLPQWTN
jgi:hypothetical protein